MTRLAALVALLIAILSVAACGAASSPSPAASTAASATAAAASPAASEGEASASAPASAEASAEATDDTESAAPSDGAIPGFSFPSEAADLEALLPDEVCGQAAQKFSFSGETILDGADEQTTRVLEELGRTADDLSMAVAAGTGTTSAESCGAGIVRIEGASTDQIRQVFLDSAEEEGDVVEERSIGGRNVFEVTSDGEKQYIWFVGDAFVFITAPEAEVEGLLEELPQP